MQQVNIDEAKTHLSQLVDKASQGDSLIVADISSVFSLIDSDISVSIEAMEEAIDQEASNL